MDYLKYINPGIESINTYEPGKSIEEVMEKYNLKNIVKLASNENSLGPSPKVLEVINNFKDVHLYPDGEGLKLKSKISETIQFTLSALLPSLTFALDIALSEISNTVIFVYPDFSR